MQHCSLFYPYTGNALILTVIATSPLLDANVKNLSVYLLLAIICLELLLSVICLLRYAGTLTQKKIIVNSEYICVVKNTEAKHTLNLMFFSVYIHIHTHGSRIIFATPANSIKYIPLALTIFCTILFNFDIDFI